jgi:hypothetical protein
MQGIFVADQVCEQAGTGQNEGVIKDEHVGELPGVTLALRNQASGVVRTTVTESDGR